MMYVALSLAASAAFTGVTPRAGVVRMGVEGLSGTGPETANKIFDPLNLVCIAPRLFLPAARRAESQPLRHAAGEPRRRGDARLLPPC